MTGDAHPPPPPRTLAATPSTVRRRERQRAEIECLARRGDGARASALLTEHVREFGADPALAALVDGVPPTSLHYTCYGADPPDRP